MIPLLCLLPILSADGPTMGVSAATFPAGWQMVQAATIEGEPVQSSKVVRVEPGSRATASKLTFKIKKPVSDRRFVFTVWLKGVEDGQWVSIDTKASKRVANEVRPAQMQVNLIDRYVTTQYARMSKEWKPYSKSFVVSRSAQELTIEISNPWPQGFLVAAPSLKAEGAQLADLDGPGVIRADLRAWVKPSPSYAKGVLTLPVPILYEDQVPLAIKVTSEPKNAIRVLRFYKRPDGFNWLCEVEVHSPARVGWQALVYVRPRREARLTKAPSGQAPPDASRWLARTSSVQTESQLIIAVAAKLSSDTPNVETYARRVAKFTCENRGAGGVWNKLDAVTSLTCAGGGSCTNRANLAAALLRLQGIPARTVAHLPTWALGQALFIHWLVEYWHPGSGWTSLESTWGEFRPPSYTTAIIAISHPDDEDASFDPLQTRWILPGAPKWAVPHLGKSLTPEAEQNQQENWARPEKRITGTAAELDRLFQQASRALMRANSNDPAYFARIERGMNTGKARDLERALK